MLTKRIFSVCPHDVAHDPEKWQVLMDGSVANFSIMH